MVNITGGSDIKLFEVDAAVNKIRAEVDPEAELIFGAIKDENMNGKIRVSIVATALNGSDTKPYLNLVDTKPNVGLNNRSFSNGDSLFNSSFVEKNVSNSIEGATALKLDEKFEVNDKVDENELSNLEPGLTPPSDENSFVGTNLNNIPSGVSIENASYMENSSELDNKNEVPSINDVNLKGQYSDGLNEEHTPQLFEENVNETETHHDDSIDPHTEKLFDKDLNEEEDFEIPAFLRKQKF